MPTVATQRAPAAPLRCDRAFYSGMALLMAATVFAGLAGTCHASVDRGCAAAARAAARIRRCRP